MNSSNNSGLQVTGSMVLVRLHKVEEKTAGGILLPQAAQDKEQLAQQIGTLVGWGKQAKNAPELDGIELGDTVFFHRYTGAHFPVDGVDFWVMKATQILGKTTRLPDFMLKGAESTASVFGVNVPTKEAA